MGVANLWTELVKYSNVCRAWSGAARNTVGTGESRDDNAEIVAELCGKVLAIDTSVWLFQCSQQSDLKDAIYDEHARVLYIVIYRIMNLLRYGSTPLFVLEGDTPEAKMGRLQQRSLAKGLSGRAIGNRRGGRHDALGRKVVELLDLMGIPHVDAPGEAEAMCAALTRVGLAHAAVTSDVDALLFGARRVYRECRVQMDNAKNNVLERVDAAEAARRCFGLRDESAGCVRALQAVACLSGCDYSVSGGKGVGVKTALEAVQQLTVGRQDDSQVLPELLRFLDTGPDPRVTALTKCTGCKTCGHEKHSRQPCPICGPGPCRPKAEGAPCECEFHRSEPKRKFMRVIARAATTGPSFSSECRATISAFEQETQRALQAAEALRQRVGSISWSRRPDVNGVFQLMHPLLGHTSADPNKLLWTYPEVRDKMRPVLMEWDMRQGPEPSAPARSLVEFRPRRIKQVAAKDGGTWAYLMEFDRIPTANPADAAFDTQQLSNSKLVKGRHVRRTLVDRLWAHLLQLREDEEQAKLAKPKKGRGKSATGGSAASGSPGGGASGGPPSVIKAGPSGRGGGSGVGAAAGVTRSGLSQGSSDVMARFLRMGSGAAVAGAAVPTNSVQQPPQRQLFASQADVAGPSGQAAARGAAQVGGAYAGAQGAAPLAAVPEMYGGGAEEEEDAGGEFQMTQRNDGGGGWAAGPAGAGAAAGGAAAGRAGHQTWASGAAAGSAAERQAGMVALWGDTEGADEDVSGLGDSRRGEGSGGRGPLYDDLEDVIPASLDELLATASQPAGRDRNRIPVGRGRQGPRGPAAPRIPEQPRTGAAAAAAATTTAAAGSINEGPFRPEPTGLGPGTGCAAAGGVSGGRGNQAPCAAGCHGPPGFGAAGNPAVGAGADVEVLDLTDSPAGAVAPGLTRNRIASAAAIAATTTTTCPRQTAAGSGENYIGLEGSLQGIRPDGRQAKEEEENREEEEEEEEEDGEALGSAVKPKARRAGAEVAGGSMQQQQQLAQQDKPERAATAAGAAKEPPAARQVRLMRTLFPDISEEALTASQARKADRHASGSGSGCAPSQQLRWQQSRDHPDSREGLQQQDDGSPSKRRNTGDGRAAAGVSRAGGQRDEAVAVAGRGSVAGPAAGAGAAGAHQRHRVAEHVDLTLDDDDEEQEEEEEDGVVDLT